jgi:hypothetical protein
LEITSREKTKTIQWKWEDKECFYSEQDLGSDLGDEEKITLAGIPIMNLMIMKERGMNYFI